MNAIEIFESAEKTSYTEQERLIIIDVILSCFGDSQKSLLYLYRQTNEWGEGETIYLIHHELLVMYLNKKYNLSMNIFLPVGFPARPPNIYFQSKPNLAINPNYVNYVVNPTNLQLNLSTITKWDPNKANFENLLIEMQKMFSNDFPLNKISQPKVSFSGPCAVNFNQLQRVLVSFEGSCAGNTTTTSTTINNNKNTTTANTKVSYNTHDNNTLIVNQQKPLISPEKNKEQFKSNTVEIKPPKELTETDIRNILQKEIEAKVKGIVIEQLVQFQDDREQLEYLKIHYQDKMKFDPDQSKLSIANSSLENLISTYRKEVSDLKEACAISESTADKELNFAEIEDIVEINPMNFLKACCIELTLEEHVLLVKKSFEKGKLSFEDSIREIRRTSREMFNIRHFKECTMRKSSL